VRETIEMPRRDRPLVWGVVNVTPDSFSDGGEHATTADATAHAKRLLEEGADVLDVGGESTRPGAEAVPPDTEAARVVPVIRALREAGVAAPISVDTRKAPVARAALEAGATIVNDVCAGLYDPAMLETVARAEAGMVLMHMRGEPSTMQALARYDDVVEEVLEHLEARAEAAVAGGVPASRLWIDPGLGFAKTFEHNEELLRALERFVASGRPVLVGASRKAFLGRLADPGSKAGTPPKDRLVPSLACAARAFAAGVDAVRVHDVRETAVLLEVLARVSPRAGAERSDASARGRTMRDG
jgi:dihydropteroate synthase